MYKLRAYLYLKKIKKIYTCICKYKMQMKGYINYKVYKLLMLRVDQPPYECGSFYVSYGFVRMIKNYEEETQFL